MASRRQVPTFHFLSLIHGHATFIPDAGWPVSRYPPALSRATTPPGFDVIPTLSIHHQWFVYTRLHGPHLTESCSAFSVTLTTRALYSRSLRRFGACAYTPAPRGPPSSQKQHGCFGLLIHSNTSAPSWRTVVCIAFKSYPSIMTFHPLIKSIMQK